MVFCATDAYFDQDDLNAAKQAGHCAVETERYTTAVAAAPGHTKKVTSAWELPITVNKLAIAIGAFNPVLWQRYLQPDPWMAQRSTTAIAGKPHIIHLLYLRFLCRHWSLLLLAGSG